MSYIDDELKIDVDEEEEESGDLEEELADPLDVIPEEDDLLDDEFIGLSDTEL
jgi:hypothetical protein